LTELLKRLQTVEKEFGQARNRAEQFSAATKNVGAAAESAGKGAEKASKGMGKFASSITRILKYRVIRSVIREIGDAFQTGLANAYQFSKGIGGELASAMDTLATKSLTMKNQLGSAFGEVLMNIMPILLRLIEVVRTAANAIAQFFAAIGGRSSYLKAVDASQEWAKSTAAGAKSAKEMRRQLMGFDEINRLDAPDTGGGGGGGGAGTDFSKMFEETMIPEWLQNLGERLRELTPILLTIAGIIAGISLLKHIGEVLGWSEAFQGVLSKIIGIAIAIAGAVLLWDGFSDALNNGVDWGNLIEMLGGTVLLVIGLGTAFGATGAAIGLLIGGIALCIVGFKEWIETGKASTEVLTAVSIGILAIGAAVALFTGSWIPAVIAGVAAAAVWLIGKWDEVKDHLSGVWNNMLSDIIAFVNDGITFLNALLEPINAILSFFGSGIVLSIPYMPTPGYATGGFPEDGMFMANHGELVGQFSNGRTAVANNEQIIQGIERGVYNAMTSAMAGQSGERDIRVYLDGKEIGAASRRYERSVNRATGVSLA